MRFTGCYTGDQGAGGCGSLFSSGSVVAEWVYAAGTGTGSAYPRFCSVLGENQSFFQIAAPFAGSFDQGYHDKGIC